MENESISLFFETADVQIDAEFEKGFNVFACESSTGKTRAMVAISLYCDVNGIKSILIDYHNYKFVTWENIKGNRFVLLNNSDLYLTKEIRLQLCKDNDIILSDTKDRLVTSLQSVHHRKISMNQDLVVIR